MTALSDALAERETVRERLSLRTGGTVALTDDHLLVATSGSSSSADDGVTRVAFDDVAEVTVEDFDYLLGALSAVLVGWGVYSIRQNAALGLVFAAFGTLTLYWTVRKRGKVRIEVADRQKPISVFPVDTAAFTGALESAMAVELDESSG